MTAYERRDWRFLDLEVHQSGNGDDFTLRGHAARFNALSEPLVSERGMFRETIEPGFFRSALREKPDVRLLINHQPYPVLARTAASTLELREDDLGLHVFARVAKDTSFGRDLAASMQRGDIDQMSFRFGVKKGGDDWDVNEEGVAIRSLLPDGCSSLADVCVATFPAYQQTEASIRDVYERALDEGLIPDEETRRQFSATERKALAAKGHALPDGSFPIENVEDLKNAIKAFGRAKDPAAAKRHIRKRAKALGATDLLPDSWKGRSLHDDDVGDLDSSHDDLVGGQEAREALLLKAQAARTKYAPL